MAKFNGRRSGKLLMKERRMNAGTWQGAARRLLAIAALWVFSPMTAQAMPGQAICDRTCMTNIVDQVLASMVTHNPYVLPLATIYSATENSHPAALGMMEAWHTITKAGRPNLLAVDTRAGQAYFMLTVSEGGSKSILYGRVRVAKRKISELEIFINRARGDHGFSYSPTELPQNFKRVMSPPANRKKASRAVLEKLALAAFNPSYPFEAKIAPACQFTELGWRVVDPGLDDGPLPPSGKSTSAPLGCANPPSRPVDRKARIIVIDPDLGIVVVAGMVPGIVYPYPYYGHMISAFIPSDMKQPQEAQEQWFKKKAKEGKQPLVKPMPATGVTMQLLQYYDGKLQAVQINVHLGGPDMKSEWVK
jgi:hypothetical protein